jgi:hypothetical protein
MPLSTLGWIETALLMFGSWLCEGVRLYAFSRSSRSRAAGEWHRSFETASRATTCGVTLGEGIRDRDIDERVGVNIGKVPMFYYLAHFPPVHQVAVIGSVLRLGTIAEMCVYAARIAIVAPSIRSAAGLRR